MSKLLVRVLMLFCFVFEDANAHFAHSVPQTDPSRALIPEEVEKSEKGIVTDTIVIHHTEWRPNVTWHVLSSSQKIRLYDSRFRFAPHFQQESHSGHYRIIRGKKVEVFYAYHWIVRSNGKVERLLNDNEVGWHSGNRDENLRSIAIVFDGDYRKKSPSKKAIKAAAKLIWYYKKQYPDIKRLIAHHDVTGKDCPGSWFYAKDKFGKTGREKLLSMAQVNLNSE